MYKFKSSDGLSRQPPAEEFAAHQKLTRYAREYVNAADFTTNNVEKFFRVFRRANAVLCVLR